jgi:hypothetical protein
MNNVFVLSNNAFVLTNNGVDLALSRHSATKLPALSRLLNCTFETSKRPYGNF